MVIRCVFLCSCQRFFKDKFNLTRKQIIVSMFIHTMGKTCICCHCEQRITTLRTFERVIGSQYSWMALQKNEDS